MAIQTIENVITGLQMRRAEIDAQVYDLHTQLTPLLAEMKRIDNFLAQHYATSRYNWTELALNCIRSHGELIQTIEILECSIGDDYSNADEKKKKNMSVALSVALNNLCENGILRKVVVKGVKGHFYGLPEWFSNEGLVQEYLLKLMEKTKKDNYSPVVLNREYGMVAN